MSEVGRKVELDNASTRTIVEALPDNKSVVDNFSDKIQSVAGRSLFSSESAAAVDSKEISSELNEGALALSSKEKVLKSVSFNPLVTVFKCSKFDPTQYWYSRQEQDEFRKDWLMEFQNFHNENFPNVFENSQAVLRINIEKFKHRTNFPSSYLEEAPSKLDLQRFRSVQNVLENRSREVPLAVRQSIQEYLEKDNNK